MKDMDDGLTFWDRWDFPIFFALWLIGTTAAAVLLFALAMVMTR